MSSDTADDLRIDVGEEAREERRDQLQLRRNQEYACPSNTARLAQGSVPGLKDMIASPATRLS